MRPKNKNLLAAYNAGKYAYRMALPWTSCPHPNVNAYRNAWEQGWLEGRREFERSTAKLKREIENLRKGS